VSQGGLVSVIRDLPVWVRWLVAGQFVSALGSLAWLFLTLYLVADRGLGPAAAGVAAGTYGVGLVAGNLLGGSAGDRWGMRPSAIAALTVSALCCLALPWLPVVALAAVASVGGFAGGAARPLLFSLVTGHLPAQRRRESVALSRSAMNAGSVIGPPVGALLSAHAFPLVFVLDGLSTLALVGIIARFVPAAGAARGERAATASLWQAVTRDRALRRLLVCIVGVDTVYRLMYTVLPLQLRGAGVPTVGYALLISLNCVVIVFAEAPIALRLRDRPAHGLIAAGFVLVGLGSALLALFVGIVAAVVMVLVVTAGEMLYKPTATAYAADLAPEGMLGRYQSAYASASISGTLLSPVLGLALYQVSPAGVWVVAGLAGVAAAVVMRPHASRGRPGLRRSPGP
jgi:MFS family permease